MPEPEQTYDRDRARNLEALLVTLAERILALRGEGEGTLLRHAGELMKLTGDGRSELFHYAVRVTYDTPEVAESRRIGRDAIDSTTQSTWHKSEWTPDAEDGPA